MEEETYYFNPERERQHYPEIPPEHTENYVLGSYYIEQYVRDWHEQAAQQRALEPTQGYPMYEFEHHAPSLIDPELEPRSEEDAVVIKQEVLEEDGVRLPLVPEEDIDEEMEDESEEPAAPVEPATVAPHELKYSTKAERDKGASIFHRREFAYCEVAMTVEEHFQIKGLNHVVPQTFSMPDKNGKYQKRKRIRITWAERDVLNDWRIRNGIKPHELRKGAKYAAAREYWRLRPPHVVKPRKTIEWSKSRGPVPAP